MKTGGSSAGGFTIVETMIVLAVTSALFVSIAGLINGRQNKTEFQSAINTAQQKLQQIINETSSGYFPNAGNFTCVQNASTQPPTVTENVAGNSQGTNIGCVFLGKVVEYGISSGDSSQFITWPIVGNQNIGTNATQTINGAYPQPVDSISAVDSLSFGLAPYAMYYNNLPAQSTAGIGFLAGDSTGQYAGTSGAGLASGSQTLSLYAILGTKVDGATPTTKSGMYSALQSTALANNYKRVDSVQLCLASGTTNQAGLLNIGNSNAGGANRQMTVTLTIFGNRTCS